RVRHRARRLGIGSAYVEGFQRALADGYEAVVTMDADWSHDPAYLPGLVAAAADHELVVGSRYLHGISVVNWTLTRLMLSQGGNLYVRTITGLPLRDCTSGFQVIRRAAPARAGLVPLLEHGARGGHAGGVGGGAVGGLARVGDEVVEQRALRRRDELLLPRAHRLAADQVGAHDRLLDVAAAAPPEEP